MTEENGLMVNGSAGPPRGFDRCVEAALLRAWASEGAACNSLRACPAGDVEGVTGGTCSPMLTESRLHTAVETSRRIRAGRVESRHLGCATDTRARPGARS